MKTLNIIKLLFVVVVLTTAFSACEADVVNEEVGIENIEQIGEDADVDEVLPG